MSSSMFLTGLSRLTNGYSRASRAGRLPAPAEGHREGREEAQDRARKAQEDEDHRFHRLLFT